MKKIAVYTDFTGVFNIPKNDRTVSAPVSVSSPLFQKYENLNWDPEVVENFNKLVSTGWFDTVSLSSWNHYNSIVEAAKIVGLTGLNRYADDRINHAAKSKREWTQWKAEFILADQLVNPSPFVWIDDNAPKFWDNYVIGRVPSKCLIIQPKSSVGLTNEHIKEIIDWSMTL